MWLCIWPQLKDPLPAQAGKRQVGFKRKIIDVPLSPELRLKGAHAEVSYSIKVYEFKIMIC